jgi:hypothetical protein
MLSVLRAVAIALAVAVLPAWAAMAQTYEAEDLTVARCTAGETLIQNLVELGFAQPGQFGRDTILWWADGPVGSVLELQVPVPETGRYAVSVGLVESWDYGIHQFTVNGKDAGPPVDLFSNKEYGTTYPHTVDLGEFDLERGDARIGLRVVGTNPKVANVLYGAGIDWIRLSRVAATTTTAGGGAASVSGFVGTWEDRDSGTLTVISPDGTWAMMNTKMPGVTPRAGNWTAAAGGVRLRTCLAGPPQLWVAGLSEGAAQKLTSGPYDLTMAWNMRLQGAQLVGTLQAWRARWDSTGKITEFKTLDDPQNDPAAVVWAPVGRSGSDGGANSQDVPDELRTLRAILELLEQTRRGD